MKDLLIFCRTKLNMSISSLKLNLSERKLNLLAEFLCSIPFTNQVINGQATEDRTELGTSNTLKSGDASSFKELDRVRRIIAQSSLVTQRFNSKQRSHDTLDPSTSDVDRYVIMFLSLFYFTMKDSLECHH